MSEEEEDRKDRQKMRTMDNVFRAGPAHVVPPLFRTIDDASHLIVGWVP